MYILIEEITSITNGTYIIIHNSCSEDETNLMSIVENISRIDKSSWIKSKSIIHNQKILVIDAKTTFIIRKLEVIK